APKMDVKFLNPVIEGTVEAIKVQCSTEVTPGKISIKKPGDLFPVEIAAVLGIMSPSFNGSIAICFPKATFLTLMEKVLGERFTEITKDLEDGAGELLNIAFGHAKRELNELGYGIEKAIPTIVRGSAIEVRHMTPSPTLILQFDSGAGKFHVEMGMTANSIKEGSDVR
ncbi:MAG: chemotaxis protein CheX, partial [Bdellovibrionota bacterium]